MGTQILKAWSWLRSNWKDVVILLALLIAVGSWRNSNKAIDISNAAYQDTRAVAGLDLRPNLRIGAYFSELVVDAVDPDRPGRQVQHRVPPNLLLWNDGPVEAVQVEVVFIQYSKRPWLGKVQWVAGPVGSSRISLQSLGPKEYMRYPIPPQLRNNSVLGAALQESPEHHALGIRLIYRRPSDKRKYVEEAFYFRNRLGEWVGEGHQTLSPEVYGPIKQEILRAAKEEYAFELTIRASDPTYPLIPDQD
jgi:hypothetical protein